MKKTLLIILVFISLGINKIHAQETSDYKVNVFHDEYGWYYCSIVNNSNITILSYANKNEYHKSGKPIYILQGAIGAPDNRNISLGEGDSNAGSVTFKVIFSDPTKKDLIPLTGTIWYKVNKGGKDQIEMEAGEETLNIMIAK